MTQTAFENVIYESEPPIGRIIFNYAQKANALSPTTVREFDAALDLARADHSIKVVIVKANGKGFCSGHEVGETLYPEFIHDEEALGSHYPSMTELFLWPVVRLWEFPKPMIAQVHGYAVGAGTYYAWLPDITIATNDAWFQMPLVQSLAYPGGETMVEPWVFMNFKLAAEYLYTAKRISAEEALAFGLVNQVVAPEDLEQTVEELAARIARAPLMTLMGTKTLIKRAWEQMGMRLHWQMSTDWLGLLANVREAHEFRMKVMDGGRNLPSKAAEVPVAPGSAAGETDGRH